MSPPYRVDKVKPNTNNWINFRATLEGAKPADRRGLPYKRRYYLGWNGVRFANNTEFKMLCAREPELVEALLGWLRGFPPGQLFPSA